MSLFIIIPMNWAFLLPSIAAIFLMGLVIMTLKFYKTTHLITLLYFACFSVLFIIVMVLRIIETVSIENPNLYRYSNLCYINGIWLLALFVDMIRFGKLGWRSILASFSAGLLNTSQMFLDRFETVYLEGTGWVDTPRDYIHFGGFVIFAATIIFVFLGNYLISLYRKATGINKKFIQQLLIVFLITGGGVGFFTVARALLLSRSGIINNLDAICIVAGFGYLQYKYIQNPTFFHIDMIDLKLSALFVIDKNSGNVLYSYIFNTERFASKDLIGGVLKGLDLILKEILESDQPLKQVVHGKEFIIFDEGKDVVVGLFVNVSSIVTINWVKQFRTAFEKKFEKDIQRYKENCVVNACEDKDMLVRQIFLYER